MPVSLKYVQKQESWLGCSDRSLPAPAFAADGASAADACCAPACPTSLCAAPALSSEVTRLHKGPGVSHAWSKGGVLEKAVCFCAV